MRQMLLFRSTKSPVVELDGQLTQESLDCCHGDGVNNFCDDKSREMSCAPGGNGCSLWCPASRKNGLKQKGGGQHSGTVFV